MMVLISYDVETASKEGRFRLRRVAKSLENFAQRVQNSVFEANLDYATFLKLKHALLGIIDEERDSLRFYYLGSRYENKIDHFGRKTSYLPEDPLIL